MEVPHLDRLVVRAREEQGSREREGAHSRGVPLEGVPAAHRVQVPHLDELVVRGRDELSIRDQHAVDARGVPREGVVLGPRARGQVDVGVHVPHLDVAVVQAGVGVITREHRGDN